MRDVEKRRIAPRNNAVIEILPYVHERDFKAVRRIHFEVGWLEDDKDAKAFEKAAPHFDGVIFPIDGKAECAVLTTPGAMRYLDTDLDMTAVMGVTTSRIARKLGAAGRLTAHSLSTAAANGSEIAVLGMFEQGFYDRLGFGTGAYSRYLRFDPTTLTVSNAFRTPQRLTKKHWRQAHQAMVERKRGHGGCVLHKPEMLRFDLSVWPNPVALGYRDGEDGALSHFFWGSAKDEHGPYRIGAYAYQNAQQLFELLALAKSLGDQVVSFAMEEPPEIQMQDLLREPFRHRGLAEGSNHAGYHRTYAYWQARILDLPKCMGKTRLDAEPVTFNLRLTDPIAAYLDDDAAWQGVAGDYTVTLGEESAAEPGQSKGLPTLAASVGAFTRMWLGVRSASSLALTDDLNANEELLRNLDRALRLPPPHLGWDF